MYWYGGGGGGEKRNIRNNMNKITLPAEDMTVIVLSNVVIDKTSGILQCCNV